MSIYEASHLIKDIPFIHFAVLDFSKQPVPQGDLMRFRHLEAQYLEDIISGRLSQAQFEAALVELVNSRITWNSMAFHGFGPLLGVCMGAGALIAFHIARRFSEATEV